MGAPPSPGTNPPVQRGDVTGERGGIAISDVPALDNTPDWQYVDIATVIAASPTYTMPAVPDGWLRRIIAATMEDTGVAAGSWIGVTRDGLAIALDCVHMIGGGSDTVSLKRPITLKPGDVFTLSAATALTNGGIMYVDFRGR